MPLTRWIRYRQARAQKKTALRMLALSGVVRLSTIELRYAASPHHNSFELSPIEQPASSPSAPDIPPSLTTSIQGSDLAHQLYSTARTLLAESKRCIQKLQWDDRKAA